MIIRCKHINYSMRRDDTYRQRLQERKKKAAATATKPHQKTQSGIPSIVGHNAGGIIVGESLKAELEDKEGVDKTPPAHPQSKIRKNFFHQR